MGAEIGRNFCVEGVMMWWLAVGECNDSRKKWELEL